MAEILGNRESSPRASIARAHTLRIHLRPSHLVCTSRQTAKDRTAAARVTRLGKALNCVRDASIVESLRLALG